MKYLWPPNQQKLQFEVILDLGEKQEGHRQSILSGRGNAAQHTS